MAAPTYVGASGGIADTTGAWASTKLGAVVGNFLIAHVYVDGAFDPAATLDSVNGCENLSGAANSISGLTVYQLGAALGRHCVYLGRATATTVSIGHSTNPGAAVFIRIYEFAGVDTSATPYEGLGHTASPGTATVLDADVTTSGAERLALNFVAIDDDNAMAAFTGMTGGTWAEAVAEFASATGTDACLQLQSATIASAATIGGGSYTMAIADNSGAIGLALNPPASAVVMPPPPTIGNFAVPRSYAY